MWGLVESGSITKIINKPKGLVIGDVRYSKKIFELWSKSELEAVGIYEVEFNNTNKKDEKWYINTDQSFAFAGGKITASRMEQPLLKLILIFYLQHKMKAMEKALKEKLKLKV
tara:strand:+ start:195 stop:533 length:339 start_codon:yes stop_codon:yes gene_type:complete